MLACASMAAAIGMVSPAAVLAQDMPATNRLNPILADGARMTAEDLQRLALTARSAGTAIPRALTRGDPAEAAILAEALAGWPLPPERAAALLPGPWSCRWLRMRHDAPLVVGAERRCRVLPNGGFAEADLSGASGGVHVDGSLLIYLGAAPFGSAEPEGRDHGRRPRIGLVQLSAPDAARIIFPAPDRWPDSLDLLAMRRPAAPGRDRGWDRTDPR